MLPGFWDPGCHPSTLTLIDFANTSLASKSSVEPICMISEGYRTHGGVTGPMKFKKGRFFFFSENRAPGILGPPGCHPSTLNDFANTSLASKSSVEAICMNSVGYRTHRAVTGPMSFKKSRRFVGKQCSRGFGAPGCHPITLIDLLHTALASKCSVKTLCLISECYRTHRAVTGSMSFKKSRRFVGKSCSRVFGAPGYIKALYLTLQTLLWPVKIP